MTRRELVDRLEELRGMAVQVCGGQGWDSDGEELVRQLADLTRLVLREGVQDLPRQGFEVPNDRGAEVLSRIMGRR